MAELNNQNPSNDGDGSEDRSFGEPMERDTETTVETTEEASGEQSTEASETSGEESKQTEEESDGTKDDKAELSEKGTKLDPNPLSRAHQELANERRIRTQMEQVLANPKLLQQFMEEQYGMKAPAVVDGDTGSKTEAPEYKEFKAEDLESLDDVAGVLNNLQKSFVESKKSYEAKIQELESQVTNLVEGGKTQTIATTMEKDVASLRQEPELDPSNSEFVDGLEQKIAEQYHKLDFDEKTGRYRGNYSIADIGKQFLEAVRMGKTKGSIKAQTIVKDKSEGKIVTSPKVTDNSTDEDSLTPGSSIAQGVSKLFQR